ncbi:MAG: DnaJ domain-containing protein [Phycisphaerae bacterium]|nr:DnaJ domain-containing protein [Phycisphaerae bacterium]
MANKRDYYEVLDVSRGATDKQIKSAYRKLARKYHPDVSKAPDADKKFREATEAYEVLSDKEKRKTYDQFGHAAFGGPGRGGAGPQGWPGGMGAGQSVSFDFGDIFGGGSRSGRSSGGFAGMGLDEILEALGGQARRRSTRGPAGPAPKGRDIEHRVMLDFLHAVRGTTTSLRLEATDPHTGKTTNQTLSVKIPPGVRDGQKIRVRGKGEEGPGGAGDLLIICHIKKHLYYRRDGNDIYVEIPIGIVEAALGSKVDVPTIDGMTTVTIPPGISGGRRLRLKGKGIAPQGKTDQRGDQYVVIKIVPPEKVTPDGKKLLEEFRETNPYDPREGAPWL